VSDGAGAAGVTSEPELVVLPDHEAVAAEAAARIAAALTDAVGARGRADWATTGGSLAPAIYRRLAAAPLRDDVPWPDVHVWWGDDRYVPREHPLSNVKPFDDILLDIGHRQAGQVGPAGQAGPGSVGAPTPAAIPLEHLHPFPTTVAIGATHGAAWCAAQVAGELERAGLERSDGWPVFDLVLLGVGGDGHVLSVFPGSPALASRDLAMAIPAPTHIEPHVERVTLNPAILGVARRVLVVAAGAAKAPVLAEIFGPKRDPHRLPGQLARRAGATWIVDAAAAERLP
jgi:6-phosphogluconolactonase